MNSQIRLALEMVGEADSALRAIGSVDRALDGLGKAAALPGRALGSVASGIADIAKNAAGFALGAGLTQLPGFLADAAKGAAADASANDRLSQSIRNLGGNFDQQLGQVNAAIVAGQKLAFTDDQVRDSYQFLAAATGSHTEALSRQKVAMDFARGANISLEMASKLTGKVTEENVQAFKRFGITVKEGASEQEALAAIQAKYAGQAQTFADSTAGQFEQSKIAISEIVESIGGALLPILASVGSVLAENLPAIQGFIGGLAGGVTEIVIPAVARLMEIGSGLFAGLMESIRPVLDVLPDLGTAIQQAVGFFTSGQGDIETFRGVLNRLLGPEGAQGAIDIFTNLSGFFRDVLAPAFVQLGGVVKQVLGGDFSGALTALGGLLAEFGPKLLAILAEWGREFLAWVAPLIPPLLAELGKLAGQLLAWLGEQIPPLLAQLATWAAAFVDWVGPQIPPLLAELGKLGAAVFDWLVTVGLPLAVEKLAAWGLAFVEWVAPRIPPLLIELGKLLLAVGAWFVSEAMPKINASLLKMGNRFWEWVGEVVLPRIGAELTKLDVAITGWLAGEVAKLRAEAARLGTAILDGVRAGIAAGWSALTTWLADRMRTLLDAAKKSLGISSPSQVAAEEIGIPLIEGIMQGIDATWPTLQERVIGLIDGLVEEAQGVGERVADAVGAGVNGAIGAINGAIGGGGSGGGPGGGGGSGSGGSTGSDGKPISGSGYLSDPLYQALMKNKGWHAQVPGRLSMDFGPAEYNAALDTVRGEGTTGTNRDKSGYFRVWYRLNSLLNAHHVGSVNEGLLTAIQWVRDNTPRESWGGLGWTIDGRASGGPVAPGRSYWVGERGPELLHMGRDRGYVQPTGAGAGQPITVHVHVAGAFGTPEQIAKSVRDGLIALQRHNGRLGLKVVGGEV